MNLDRRRKGGRRVSCIVCRHIKQAKGLVGLFVDTFTRLTFTCMHVKEAKLDLDHAQHRALIMLLTFSFREQRRRARFDYPSRRKVRDTKRYASTS